MPGPLVICCYPDRRSVVLRGSHMGVTGVSITELAAVFYALVMGAVVLFHLALAVGAPWGSYGVGDAYPERYPPAVRVATVFQSVGLSLMAGVVLSRAGLLPPSWPGAGPWLIWIVVVLDAAAAARIILRSTKRVRNRWGAPALILLACSVIVAATG